MGLCFGVGVGENKVRWSDGRGEGGKWGNMVIGVVVKGLNVVKK